MTIFPKILKLMKEKGLNYSPAKQQNIIQSLFLHEFQDLREDRHVRTAQETDPHDIDVFLQCRLNNHFRRLTQSGIDHLHPGISQSRGNNFYTSVVTVEAGFRNKYSYR